MPADRPGRRPLGVGELGWRLMVVFVGVVLAAMVMTVGLTTVTSGIDVSRLVDHQKRTLTRAVAVSAGAAYRRAGWAGELDPAFELAAREGAAARVRDTSGRVIGSSLDFALMPARPAMTVPVEWHDRQVGTATVRFGQRGLGAIGSQFETRRWHARLEAAAISILLALVASLLVARRITTPLESVLAAMRARAAGDRDARVSDVRAVGVLREIGEGFNEAMDALDARDQVRRNVVATMAHEVRTPVAVLQAGVEAMLDGVTELSAPNVAGLRDEVLRLGRMIDDLQALAAAEAAALQLTLEPHDLAAIAAQASARLGDSFEAAGVSLTRRLTEVRVECDLDRMLEVISNLLTNALKFTRPGGEVVIETWPESREEGKVRVSDTGMGIPPDELPLVTERFFRGRRAAEVAGGRGIGLAIVDELVGAHHGRLEISSRPGMGTKVTITLRRV